MVLEAADNEDGMSSPEKYDGLLPDITHDKLMDVAQTLNVTYLEESQEIAHIVDGVMALRGTLYGTFLRPMVNVAIFAAKYKKPINVIFLVDTASPYVYVCESAMAALGFNDHFPGSFKFHIAGCPNVALQAHMSKRDSHFSGINVIGQSALSKLRAKVTFDYLSDYVEMKFNSNRASP
jgi:hypothetical protein